MILADIKKLKVAELRSRLKEMGLDSKGLKTELVVRLWSAFDSGVTEVTEGNHEIPVKPQPTHSPPLETAEVPAPTSSPLPPETRITAPCCPETNREFTDSATQTDTEARETASQHGSELRSEPEEEEEKGEEEEEERRGPSLVPDTARGRAFYEFKEEIRYKRMKSPQPPVLGGDEAEEEDEDKVRLNPHDRHLHFELGPDGSGGQPRFWAQFPSLWSGCRLTHGVRQGRVGFEVRLERKLLATTRPEEEKEEEEEEEQEEDHTCGVRVGWSLAHSSLLLGEDDFSFAFDACSKKVCGGREEQFGECFSEGDIIGCYASFSTEGDVQLSFHKNGRFLGMAFSLGASTLQGRPLFPHVLCRSCSVRFHLEPAAPPWYPSPPGFTLLAALPAGQRECLTPAPSPRAQCEVLLMVGLPGSGKSHWAQTHMKQHPRKRFQLLGIEELLTCVMGSSQTGSILRRASQCLTDLIKIAAQTPANYILDQCNILFSARRHKLQLFSGFRRRVVVVFPSADEWRRRRSLQPWNEEEHVPETALLKLQVSCSLPELDSDLMEALQYVELPQEAAQKLLQELRVCARRLLPPVPTQEKKKPRHHRRRPYPPGCPPPPPPHRAQWSRTTAWNHPRHNIDPWSRHPRYWNAPHLSQSFDYNRNYSYIRYEDY